MKTLILFGLGFLGAVLGNFVLLLRPAFQRSLDLGLVRFIILLAVEGVVGGVWSLVNATFFDFRLLSLSRYYLVAYTGFVGSLFLSESVPSLVAKQVAKQEDVKAQTMSAGSQWGFVQPLPVGLVLNGFWAVYAVGTFGGLLAELVILYQDRRKKKRYPPEYWIITAFMILVSGGLAAIYGVSNVSAPLALQLGASAPLIMKRLRR